MSLIYRRRRPPSINIVPLVDVLTVLLFFFLVTMQFKQVSALNITAPEIKTAGKNQVDEQIVIAVSPDGEFFLNDREVNLEQLERAIELAGQLTPDLPVLLIVDQDAALKFVAAIV
jgi:biopolymer transport protein ExbD